MAKRYRLWPCQNRPREGPENLAKIETRATGFLATPKARSAHSLASASTPASRHPISTRSGCSCGSYESSWNAVAGRRSSLSKRSSPGSRRRPERDRLLDAARRREIDIIPSGTYRFRDHRLKAPELMKDVYQGAKYVNGVPVNQVPEEKAA